MNSELKEFLEWTKTVRRQFEIDMDETWVTKPSIERVAIENLLIAYDQMAERLRSPSPSGGIKTAEEILDEIAPNYTYLEEWQALKAMRVYHEQFGSQQLTDKVNYSEKLKDELSPEHIAIINMLADKEPSCYADIADIIIEYNKAHNQFAGDGWISVRERLPEENVKVWGALQHWHTKNYRYTEIKKVKESDCDWRTCDDNSEISYEWTVTHWQPLPQAPQNKKE